MIGIGTTLDPAEVTAWAFAAMLVLARIGCACMVLPAIGETEVPATVRLGLVLALIVLLLPIIRPGLPAMPDSEIQVAKLVAAEAFTGFWFGWLTRLWLLALPAAGHTIAAMTGLSNVLQPDPSMGGQVPVLARALGLAMPTLVLVSGLYRVALAALVQSYDIVPAGVAPDGGDVVAVMLRAAAGSVSLSLSLASPFVVAGIIWQVALALLARLVPQLQIYFAAMPGQILAGLLMLALLGGGLLAVWQEATIAAMGELIHA